MGLHTHDIERRLAKIVELKLNSGGGRLEQSRAVASLFPSASSQGIDIKVFRTSLEVLGFDVTTPQCDAVFKRCAGPDGRLDLPTLQACLRRDRRGRRPRPHSAMPAQSSVACQRALSGLEGKSLGRKSTFVTDSRVPPQQIRRSSFSPQDPYETTYEARHGRSTDLQRNQMAHSHAAFKDSMMWQLGSGIMPARLTAGSKEYETFPRNKSWVTAPMTVSPEKLKQRTVKQRRYTSTVEGTVPTKELCDFYVSKYMLDTCNTQMGRSAAQRTNPRSNQSCIALAAMGCFPKREGSKDSCLAHYAQEVSLID